MSDARSGAGRSGYGGPSRGGEFDDSVGRLQRAMDELVSTASDRASAILDETSSRLERELDKRQQPTDRQAADRSRSDARRAGNGSRSSGGRDRSGRSYGADPYPADEAVPVGLYRDLRRARICGVCAGIARYYRVEPWVVRCVAITGLLFFPQLVFPAYFIACFVMDKPPGSSDNSRSARRRSRRSRRRDRRDLRDDRSPAPELGPRFSPRYSLRNVQADLTEVELRLRRMETHVTSGQYELQRELNKIAGGSDGRAV